MSNCISREGEYSDHKPDKDFCCTRCFALDETGLLARVRELEAERDAALAAIERVRAVCLHLGGVDGDVSQPAPSYYTSIGRNVVATEVLAALDGAPEPEEKP